MSVKSSQFSLGTTARTMELLGELGVMPGHQQAVIDNPIRRATVAAALRGDFVIERVTLDQLVERETNIVARIFGTDRCHVPVIARALRQSEEAWGGLTANDRFIPGDLDLSQIFSAFYEHAPNLKLYHERNKEWWRTDNNVQRLPTETGVIRLDFVTVMQPTNLAGAPFNMTQPEQEKWAEPDGITSAEELCYLQLRSCTESGHPLWGYGWARCRNACGSDSSLDVSWSADSGWGVEFCGRGAGYVVGAVRRKYLALGA